MLIRSACYKILLLFFLLIDSGIQLYAFQNNVKASPPDYLVTVEPNLYIGRIYNIDLVDESYQIDGSLSYTWFDERLIYDPKSSSTFLTYKEGEAENLMRSEIWVPTLEFINIQSSRETNGLEITVKPDGKVIYTEHFSGTFHTQMQSEKYPFDSKTFLIVIEPFLYNKETLKFGSSLLLPEKDSLMNLNLGDSWMLTNTSSRIDSTIYDQYSDLRSGVESSTFSKIIFEVQAKRNHRYYILHLLIPTLLIALISFMIFWIQHFRAQIFIGITSLSAMIFLVVYSAPDIPKLPYNTFIEYIFIIGNLFILFGIIAALANHRFLKNSQRKFDLLKICRRVIPLTFLLVLVAVTSFIF